MSASRAQQVKRAVENAFSNDGTRMGVLEDCARFAIPREQDLYYRSDTTEGDEKPQPVDGVAVTSLNRFVNFTYTNTIGTLSNLFSLKDMDERRNNIPSVSKWYAQLSERVIKLIQSSNLSATAHEMLCSWSGYGQGFHSVEMDELSGKLLNRNYSANSAIRMTVDADGHPDGIFIKRRFAARQALAKFGPDMLPAEIIKKAKNAATADVKETYYYSLQRRQKRERERKMFRGMEFEALWVVCSGNKEKIVSESGFRTFPFQCPRFSVVDGETYGRGLVHQAMYDVRAKQRARNDYFNAIEKAVDPTLVTNDEDLSGDWDNTPGAVNYAEGDDVTKVVREIASKQSVPAAKDLNEELEAAVRQAMMTDMLDVLERDKVYNNPQTLYLIDQQVTALLPGMTRLRMEFFQAYVERVIDLVLGRDEGLPAEQRMLDTPPEELVREDGSFLYTVSFTMRIDDKIKSLQNQALLTFAAQAVEMKQAYEQNPKLAALIPEEKALRHLAQNNNVDPDLINSEEDYKTAWAEYQRGLEQQQQQAMLAQMVQPVDTGKAPEPGSLQEGMAHG